VRRFIALFTVFMLIFLLCAQAHASPLIAAVTINEFLPNPVGDDSTTEWIELYNAGSVDVPLDGWVLSDVYGTVKNFSLSGKTITAGGYLVLYRSETMISLNNDTEQVKLVDPAGNVELSAIVNNAVEGKSYALINGSWSVSDPTPGAANAPVVSPAPSANPSPSPAASPTVSPSATPDSSPTPSPTVALEQMQALQITEVLACGGSTEWVELYNPNAFQIFLNGWKIQDSSTQVKLLDDSAIAAHGYLVKEWAGYMLNNDGDEVRLFRGDELVDSFTYNSCAKGYSWAKIGDTWVQTQTITKGNANPSQVTKTDSSDQETSVAAITSPTPAPITRPNPASSKQPSPAQVVSTLTPHLEPDLPALFGGQVLGSSIAAADLNPFSNTPFENVPAQPTQRSTTANKIVPVFWLSSALWYLTAGFLFLERGTIFRYV
jgi:hypothetical protein